MPERHELENRLIKYKCREGAVVGEPCPIEQAQSATDTNDLAQTDPGPPRRALVHRSQEQIGGIPHGRNSIEFSFATEASVVELAPPPGLVAPNFLCAKLIDKILSYRFGAEVKRQAAVKR
ncbi:MAG: hypothetical protein LBQ09_03705 [Acidobacteriaceae bacterium]|nr:hypothetical protein [Acidobacteriaceae bacterium]